MKAKKLIDYKVTLPNGVIVQAVLWEVPTPVPPTTHGYKYRLVAVKEGQRVIGFDNERGKGDHRHDADVETPYVFVSVEKLMADFLQAVKELK
jgi:Family of unknown function (DUF6516)